MSGPRYSERSRSSGGPAAAEGRARAAQFEELDRLVGLADQQCVKQRLPQSRAERVAPCRVVEDDREPPPGPADPHRFAAQLAAPRGAPLAEPPREPRPA